MKNEPHEPWSGYADIAEKDTKKFEITVADKTFPMRRWREGILYFLFGVWSGDKRFWHDPSICFGDLKLTLKNRDSRTPEKEDHFVIEGTSPDQPINSYYGNYSLRIRSGSEVAKVMDALVRFAKDPCLGKVDIDIDDKTTLTLFGKERRGEYGCSVYVYR